MTSTEILLLCLAIYVGVLMAVLLVLVDTVVDRPGRTDTGETPSHLLIAVLWPLHALAGLMALLLGRKD